MRDNLIYQSAALHALDEANERGLGVVTMRSMTSGIFGWFSFLLFQLHKSVLRSVC